MKSGKIVDVEGNEIRTAYVWCEYHQCMESFRFVLGAGPGCAGDRFEVVDPPECHVQCSSEVH